MIGCWYPVFAGAQNTFVRHCRHSEIIRYLVINVARHRLTTSAGTIHVNIFCFKDMIETHFVMTQAIIAKIASRTAMDTPRSSTLPPVESDGLVSAVNRTVVSDTSYCRPNCLRQYSSSWCWVSLKAFLYVCLQGNTACRCCSILWCVYVSSQNNGNASKCELVVFFSSSEWNAKKGKTLE